MVTHSRRHTAKKCRHLRTCLSETENVVHKEEDVFTTTVLVAELLCHGQTRKCHTQTCAWWLVHLAKHESSLRLLHSVHVHIFEVPFALRHVFLKLVAILDYAALDHFTKQVVTFTSTFTYTGKHGETIVSACNIVDKLHNKHGFTNTGTTKQTNLTTLGEWFDKVDYLDTCVQNLLRDRKIGKRRRWLVNSATIATLHFLEVVDWLANHIQQSSFHLFASGNRNGLSKVFHLSATLQTVGTVHCNAAHGVFTNVLLHLQDDFSSVVALYRQSGIDFGHHRTFTIESNVHHWANYLGDFSIIISHNHENAFVVCLLIYVFLIH